MLPAPPSRPRGVLAILVAGILVASALPVLATPPATWDWRDVAGHSYVTPVRNQGACGSAVYFGAVAMMEAAILIADHTPDVDLDLSEQYVMACGRYLPAMYECAGAYPGSVLQFLRNVGVPPESVFPYLATSGLPCPAVPAEQLRRILGYAQRYNGVSPDTIRALAARRPVVAAVYAGNDFMAYDGGVFRATTPPPEPDDMNHVLLVVGWGNEQGTDYWICKNSWGTVWGDDGYIRIAAVRNQCNFGLYVWTLAYESATGIAEPPRAATLTAAPNPFNPCTWIAFETERSGEARLEVFDLGGRAVRLLRAGTLAAGRHELIWDGHDDRGRDLPAGVYCVRLVAGERRESRRVALIR